ncbi:MAG: hypothetical protein GYA87_05115 [Christensenellaceae bacterium]|nr:hypothetical protein [Christensenellaceae bacterium]
MTKVIEFKKFIESLSTEKQEKLTDFFVEVNRHLSLPSHFKEAIILDFENALLYYKKNNVGLDDALNLLNPEKLGGFYARPALLWYPLDDAAKIYPMNIKRNQMSIFRVSAYLKNNIVPELMQMALNFTIKRFPFMATTVKNGFFWHYLDTTKRRFKLKPEIHKPCMPINVAASGSQSFRLLYYKNRLSVEFFHVLTDGNGAIVFLNTLLAEYLRLLGNNIPCNDQVLDINDVINSQETENEFANIELKNTKAGGFGGSSALQLSGNIAHSNPSRILHFEMETDKLLEKSRASNTSLTAYLLAYIFVAAKYSTEAQKGNLNIQVPVNLRKFYNKKTLRNFVMFCKISNPIDSFDNIEEIIPEITKQLKEKSTLQAMEEMVQATIRLVRSLKYVPLFIKRPVAKLAYGFLGDKVFTCAFSNLGNVSLPVEMRPYIDKYDVVMGASSTNRVGCTCISFNNKTVLSLTKNTEDPSFEEKLAMLFKENGIAYNLEGSPVYES